MRAKERILGGQEGKMKLRDRGSVETIVKTVMSLFIGRVPTTYYLLYFSLFIIL